MDARTQTIISELRKRLERIYDSRLLSVHLYGSRARGDAEAGSDIDLLVVLDGRVDPGKEIDRTGDITSRLSLEHNVVVSCLLVSAHRHATDKRPMLLNVSPQGIHV